MEFDEYMVWNIYDSKDNVARELLDVFTKFYALNKLNVYFKNEDKPLCIEKFNVLSYTTGDDFFTVYETSSLDIILTCFNIDNVVKITKI